MKMNLDALAQQHAAKTAADGALLDSLPPVPKRAIAGAVKEELDKPSFSGKQSGKHSIAPPENEPTAPAMPRSKPQDLVLLDSSIIPESVRVKNEINQQKRTQQEQKEQSGSEPEAVTREAAIHRLAKLSQIDYEAERKAAAKQMGFRAGALDGLVHAKREELTKQRREESMRERRSSAQSQQEKPPQSVMADQLQAELKEYAALDALSSQWMRRTEGSDCWTVVPKRLAEAKIERSIQGTVEGYDANYLKGVVTLLGNRLLVAEWTEERHLIPMQNGVMNLNTRQLEPFNGRYRFNWQLPYPYDPTATCPTVERWLDTACQCDDELARFLLCYLAAILRGRYDLQKYIELIGHGGTGKSTFARLARLLVGECNSVTTELKQLEQNRFESARLYGKRLVIVSDSSRYGGEVSQLKALTGGDHLRFERKGVDASEDFVFKGLVLIAANENIQSTDYTSGLARRRITVNFNHIVTEDEKLKFPDFEQRIQAEVGGLFNRLLEISDEQITDWIRHPPAAVQKSRLEAEIDTNPILGWMVEYLIHCPAGEESSIGFKSPKGQMPELDKLYPHYCDWVEGTGRQAVSVVRFGSLVVDNLVSRGFKTEVAKHPTTRRSFIRGVRLRNSYDKNTERVIHSA